MTRQALHPRDPELVGLVRASGVRARAAAIFAARAALGGVSVAEGVVEEALHALARSDMRTASHLRPELERLLQALDGVYWDLVRASSSPDNPAVQSAFAKARAVNSLVSALGSKADEAALDAIYEAQAALPGAQVESFMEQVESLLRG